MSKRTTAKQYVFFIGGQTAGPLVPLLAIADTWTQKDSTVEPIFIDIKKSVAAQLVPQYGYIFKTIMAGKLRRYLSLVTMLEPVKIIIGFLQSMLLLYKYQPILVMGAGGYVQFPVIFAAWLMRVPCVIHQQDMTITLSNQLTAPFVVKITTTFQKSVKDFSQGVGFANDYSKLQKVVWTGNPVRSELLRNIDRDDAAKQFGLNPKWPIVLVIGGGSGAVGLNTVMSEGAPELLKFAQIIHSTGQGKAINVHHERYRQMPFITDMAAAYAASDVVIARAGIGTITELSKLSKCSILVPMPDSHQEANAQLLFEQKAALVLDQGEITPQNLAGVIRKLFLDLELQKQLQKNIATIIPKDSNERMLKIIQTLTV